MITGISKFGNYSISGFKGSAAEKLFYSTNGADTGETEIPIQFSNITDDNLIIEKPKMSTATLGINSITVSQIKYAQKATSRLDEALDKVSSVRSYFGAMQNRLESSVNNNENKSENVTAAESQIRDADMAKEVMELTKHNILEQATTAMLSQANSSMESVLSLLR